MAFPVVLEIIARFLSRYEECVVDIGKKFICSLSKFMRLDQRVPGRETNRGHYSSSAIRIAEVFYTTCATHDHYGCDTIANRMLFRAVCFKKFDDRLECFRHRFGPQPQLGID